MSRFGCTEERSPAVASGALPLSGLLRRQSGKPAASGGFVALDVEPLAVELVLLVLGPLLVLGVSLRTCLVTLFQHFIAPGEAS